MPMACKKCPQMDPTSTHHTRPPCRSWACFPSSPDSRRLGLLVWIMADVPCAPARNGGICTNQVVQCRTGQDRIRHDTTRRGQSKTAQSQLARGTYLEQKVGKRHGIHGLTGELSGRCTIPGFRMSRAKSLAPSMENTHIQAIPRLLVYV
jgi:hypothetical protein